MFIEGSAVIWGVCTARCRLNISVPSTVFPPNYFAEDSSSALLSLFNDYKLIETPEPLYFVSYAISGAAAVYIHSIGSNKQHKTTDILGRQIIKRNRELFSFHQTAALLRITNLHLSVALAVSQCFEYK